MKIENIEVIRLNLPFKTDFKISRGSVGSPQAGAPHILIKITSDTGGEGWGEARPSHRWSYETAESVITTISNYLSPALKGRDAFDIDDIHEVMNREIAPGFNIGQPIAKSGVDMALHDLVCKELGISLRDYFGSKRLDEIELSYMISKSTPEEAQRSGLEAKERGYRGFKVKIGLYPQRDLDILRAVKEVVGDSYLWADANQAWTVEDTLRQAERMKDIGVDVLEQPIPANDITGLARLVRSLDLPIAVDETVFSPSDLIQLIKLEAIGALVIKVSKMGGLWHARQCIEIARSAGIALLGSGLTETRLGLTASAHLYASFGIDTPVDLNGPQFLADDIVRGALREETVIKLPQGSGIGVELDEEKIAKYRV